MCHFLCHVPYWMRTNLCWEEIYGCVKVFWSLLLPVLNGKNTVQSYNIVDCSFAQICAQYCLSIRFQLSIILFRKQRIGYSTMYGM